VIARAQETAAEDGVDPPQCETIMLAAAAAADVQSAVAKARAYQIAGDENDTLRKERARLAANS